jgi:hypothetical protein
LSFFRRANCRFLTPCFRPVFPRFQLPGFDAAKTEGRIQKTGNRTSPKSRRQKRVVGFAGAKAKMTASETGSWLRAWAMPGIPLRIGAAACTISTLHATIFVG